MKINGKVALVTGANGGIGRCYVKGLQTAGVAKIYAAARHSESLNEIVATDPERIIPVTLDITNEKSVSDAATLCSDVNLLINNAGIELSKGLIAASDLSWARKEMEVNYFGTLAMCRAFAPILKGNGGGAIVNMLSTVALVTLPFNGSYCASKAATRAMTQGVRAELAQQGTLVIAVIPGTVDTEMSKNYPPPKVSPDELVQEVLQAVIDEVEDVYPGEQAKAIIEQLTKAPKELEKQMAAFLPKKLWV